MASFHEPKKSATIYFIFATCLFGYECQHNICMVAWRFIWSLFLQIFSQRFFMCQDHTFHIFHSFLLSFSFYFLIKLNSFFVFFFFLDLVCLHKIECLVDLVLFIFIYLFNSFCLCYLNFISICARMKSYFEWWKWERKL